MLFSAFDLTCTTNDSSATLAEMAIALTPKSGGLLSSISSPKMKEMWQTIQDQYTYEYEERVQIILQENSGTRNSFKLKSAWILSFCL